MARFFGPITLVWFVVLAGLGVYHIADDPSIIRALSPHYGAEMPAVLGDPVQLQQVVVNLVVYAIEAVASLKGREVKVQGSVAGVLSAALLHHA